MPRTPARFLLLAVLALLLSTVMAGFGARADLPSSRDNGDASTTVSWAMNESAGMTAQNITFSGGRAMLPWVVNETRWDRASQFVSNGALDQNLTATGSGISLRSDETNYVRDGDFSTQSPWNYENGTSGAVTAGWNSTRDFAQLGHVAAQTPWEDMDSVANWTYTSGITGFVEKGGQQQGSGMMGLEVISWPVSSGYGGAVWTGGRANWSAYDRLILWVRMNASLTVSFNVTANVGSAVGPLKGTVPVSLGAGWQELVLDLGQLGSSSSRSNLYNVMLRFNAVSVSQNTWFYIDDVRLGTAEFFNETASVRGSFVKANRTASSLGSGRLSFDWCLVNAAGVAGYAASINLTGPGASYRTRLSGGPLGRWQSFASDVSSATAANGSYELTFRFQVAVKNATAVDARLWVDNVTLAFPDRHNGSYLSNPVFLTSRSAFLNLTWTADIPVQTNALLSLRAGNDSNPDSSGWGSWTSWGTPGGYGLALPPNLYFQLRVDLGTTNASVTPVLHSFILEIRHRASQGTLASTAYTVQPTIAFLNWRLFSANWSGTASSSITYWANAGAGWIPILSGGSMSTFQGRTIHWRAVLTTSDGVLTPTLSQVNLTYEYLGPISRVAVTPSGVINVTSGQVVQFQAVALDVGDHVVSYANFTWHTTGPDGIVHDSNATFLAGAPGIWKVTATVQGVGVSGIAWVNVSAAQVQTPLFGLPGLLLYWPYFVAVLGAAALGLVGFEAWSRRAFAIDDVFLISKDGRLIMHNTRRMRADRDEDILSGMLTAILAFIRDSDPEENGELKGFEIGGKTTLLERGEHVYLTAIYSGRVPRWAPRDLRRFVRDLEARFGSAFASWSGSPEDLQGVKAYMDRLASRARYRRPPAPNARAA